LTTWFKCVCYKSTDKVYEELLENDVEGSGRDEFLRFYTRIHQKRRRKKGKTISQNSYFDGKSTKYDYHPVCQIMVAEFLAVNNQSENCTKPTEVHFIFNKADSGFGIKYGNERDT
jgi:hypothetical protein